MDKFEESEIKGRKLLENMIDLLNATDKQETDYNERVDYYFKLNGKSIVSEIKVRDIKYENRNTHLMEVSKFNALERDLLEKHLDAGFYVCFFGENIVYWYSIPTIKKYAIREKMKCNRTTAINTGKTLKDVLLIPRNKGTKFVKVKGVWKISEK